MNKKNLITCKPNVVGNHIILVSDRQIKEGDTMWMPAYGIYSNVQERPKTEAYKVEATTNLEAGLPLIGLAFATTYAEDEGLLEDVDIELLDVSEDEKVGIPVNEYTRMVKTDSDGCVIIHEKMYSKSEIINALHKAELKHDKDYSKIWAIMEENL